MAELGHLVSPTIRRFWAPILPAPGRVMRGGKRPAHARERLAEISDLGRMFFLAAWDQRVMPTLGGPARGGDRDARLAHEEVRRRRHRRAARETAVHEESLEYDSDDASLIRVTRRDWEKAKRVPSDLRAEMLRAEAQGHQIWVDARANNDFSAFLPTLERDLDLKKRYVDCLKWDDSPYTPLLDDFEPFMKATDVAEVFDTIRPVLAELVREAPSGVVLRRPVSAGAAARVRRACPRDGRLSRRLLAARHVRAPLLYVVLTERRPPHDAVPPNRDRIVLVDHARGGPRPVLTRHRVLTGGESRSRRRPSG